MSISKCIVRLKDCHNTKHSVEVYAESLYEAVLRGLGRLQDVGWGHERNNKTTLEQLRILIFGSENQKQRFVAKNGTRVVS
jgi:hypothetical protein